MPIVLVLSILITAIKIIETGIEVPIYINPNRLNNSWHIGVFAGFGIGWYHVDVDQRNGLGNAYDYAGPDFNDIPNLSESDVISLLEREWDGDYETAADGFDDQQYLNNIMPTFGLELGYISLKDVTVGLKYRVTLSGEDLLDGIQWENDNSQSSDNDILHFPGIFLKWNIKQASNTKTVLAPEIEMKTPIDNDVVTQNPLAIIRTKVRYIKSVKDLNISHNGFDYDVFQYYNKELATNVPLIEGENKIIITASNNAGTDQVIYNYTYTPGANSDFRGSKPIIKFIEPEVDNQNVLGLKMDLKIDPIGVSSERDLRIFVNEQEQLDFIYDKRDPYLNLPIQLNQGKNTIKVVAINKNGVSQVSRDVYTDNSGALTSFNLIKPEGELLSTNTESTPVEILINGQVDEKDLQFLVNDKKYPYEYDPETQRVTSNVMLLNGTNIIELIVKNKTSNVKQKIKVLRSGARRYVDKEPELDLSKRSGEFEVSEFIPVIWNNSNATCSYNLELIYPSILDGDEIEIFLNNQEMSNFTIFKEEKILRKSLTLNQGTNYLKIRDNSRKVNVYDKILNCNADNSGVAQPDVVEKVDVPQTQDKPVVEDKSNITDTEPIVTNTPKTTTSLAPSINVVSPSNVKTDLSSPNIRYEAYVTNVSSRNDLTIYFNKDIVQDYSFDPSSGKVVFERNASQEKNSISLIVVNAQGVADDVRFLSYVKLDPPEIYLSSPQNQSTFETNVVQFSGQILRTENSGVVIKNNGRIVSDWTREGNSINGTFNLNEGVNKIEITAGNLTASKTKTIYIYYDPILSPVIKFISPEAASSEVVNSRIPLIASISSVKSKDRIELLINGTRRSDFNFENGSLNTMLNLREGTNQITIIASNKIGQDNKQITIDYRVPRPPRIQFVRPFTNRQLVKETPYKMEARIDHINTNDRVKLKLNGVLIESPQLSANGLLSQELDLIVGINEIVIEAENQDGGDAQSISVSYVRPKPPIINLLSPQGDIRIESSQLDLQANVLRVEGANNINVLCNGTAQRFTYSESALRAQVPLVEGNNIIVITANNLDGDIRKEINVEYKKPVPPPIIDWYAPRESGTEVRSKLYTLRLKVDHVISKNSISLLFNGQSIDFSFDPERNLVNAEVLLLEGINEINIEANNETGSARAKSTINYKKSVDPSSRLPRTRIISTGDIEKSAFDSNLGQLAMVAEVANINDKNQILLLVNNQALTNFVFQKDSGRIIATIPLRKGVNNISVKVTNQFGSSSDTRTITF